MVQPRNSPSGALSLLPLLQSLDLDGSTLPIVYTLAAAGHAPGLYQVGSSLRIRQVATSGQITLTLTWSSPKGNDTFVIGGFNLNTLLTAPQQTRCLKSSGVAPILITMTVSVAIVGSPLFDFYTAAALQLTSG